MCASEMKKVTKAYAKYFLFLKQKQFTPHDNKIGKNKFFWTYFAG